MAEGKSVQRNFVSTKDMVLTHYQTVLRDGSSKLNYLLIEFGETGGGEREETSVCGSLVDLCVHWLILAWALTRAPTSNLGVSGQPSNLLSEARAHPHSFRSS